MSEYRIFRVIRTEGQQYFDIEYVKDLVTCAECKHWTYHKRLDVNWCRTLHTDMKADDFCSYGEREGE